MHLVDIFDEYLTQFDLFSIRFPFLSYRICKSLRCADSFLFASTANFYYFCLTYSAGIESDLVKMDVIVLPLSLMVLALNLNSWRLMLLPIVSIIVSILTSFTIMLPIALYSFNTASMAPSIQMSLTVAMSIDYCLFLLNRYTETLKAGKSVQTSVRNMVFNVGRVVIVSGTTLAITFLGLCFFAIDFMVSLG
jgi:RND superfamily putative drug exporter